MGGRGSSNGRLYGNQRGKGKVTYLSGLKKKKSIFLYIWKGEAKTGPAHQGECREGKKGKHAPHRKS